MRFKIGDDVCIKAGSRCNTLPNFKQYWGVPTTIIARDEYFGVLYWTLNLVAQDGKGIAAREVDLEHLIKRGSWDEITNSLGFDLRKERELAAN